MKSRSVLIRVCIYIAMSLIMLFLESNVNNILLGILCLLLYAVALWVLVSWRTFNCIWVCDECGKRFKITLWVSFKSFFIFSLKTKLYHRQLYCHKCNENTWCRCIFQE
ncbi:MAG: hypothetical protein ACJAX4_003396 [Clostridium sp.]